MPPRYAKDTEVAVSKTRAEIEHVARSYGADGFVSGYEGNWAMVQFRAHDRLVKFVMDLPAREGFTRRKHGGRTVTEVARSPAAADKAWDQACRQRWRSLLLLVRAKLEAVESGIVSFEQEFFAHVVLPDGGTVYERAREPVALAYRTGTPQLLIEPPR